MTAQVSARRESEQEGAGSRVREMLQVRAACLQRRHATRALLSVPTVVSTTLLR